ncbi:MAG: archease [Deltaproteobacteria bacterium]|nr:archease [Deltaproteobacteria bacterium]MBW2595826.1 archease [Deltaproteobacteria bacterium]MBW2650080.1 archease [Deltaproteobacteria bacterium]
MDKDKVQAAIPPYRIFDHTADLGVEIYGRNERELFCNAAFALFDIVTDVSLVHVTGEWEVFAEGGDLEELLVNFLREILYMCSGEGLLLKEFMISEMDNFHVKGTARGEPFIHGRHCMNIEIKAITYHRVEIRKASGTWVGRVIFDV